MRIEIEPFHGWFRDALRSDACDSQPEQLAQPDEFQRQKAFLA